jgi:hypothetical protein
MAKRVHADISGEVAQAFRQALKIRDHREAQLADDKHCRGVGLCEVCDEYGRLVATKPRRRLACRAKQILAARHFHELWHPVAG